jgi:N-methylhydantoinase A/oxoprolinase/acetone carboxylase beta subunit
LLCVDFGSTFTKAVLVDAEGSVVATAATPTTIGTDVLDGYRVLRAELAAHGPGRPPGRAECRRARRPRDLRAAVRC